MISILSIVINVVLFALTFALLRTLFDSKKKEKAREKKKVVKVVFKGMTSNVIAEVTSSEPTDEDERQVHLRDSLHKTVTWLVKCIEWKYYGDDEYLEITFWNGLTGTIFDYLYIIEKEVSHE